jgi:hypothetical protein
MGSSIETCTIVRADEMDPETAVVRYRKQEDGWYVQTPKDAEFRVFARPEASDVDVVQLINKKWDARYGDPDPWKREKEIETTQASLHDVDRAEADDA